MIQILLKTLIFLVNLKILYSSIELFELDTLFNQSHYKQPEFVKIEIFPNLLSSKSIILYDFDVDKLKYIWEELLLQNVLFENKS